MASSVRTFFFFFFAFYLYFISYRVSPVAAPLFLPRRISSLVHSTLVLQVTLHWYTAPRVKIGLFRKSLPCESRRCRVCCLVCSLACRLYLILPLRLPTTVTTGGKISSQTYKLEDPSPKVRSLSDFIVRGANDVFLSHLRSRTV